MSQYTLRFTFTTPRPRTEVYDLLEDISAHEQFMDHFVHDFTVEGDPRAVGAVARFRVKGAGRHDQIEITVTDADPGRRIEEHGRGGKDLKSRSRGIYELADSPLGGTEVTFTQEGLGDPGLLERMQIPFAKAYLKRNNGKAMKRLEALLAQG